MSEVEMFKCRACKEEISINATSCPKCGETEPNAIKFKEKTIHSNSMGFALFGFFVGGVWAFSNFAPDIRRKWVQSEGDVEHQLLVLGAGLLFMALHGVLGAVPLYWVTRFWQQAESAADFFIKAAAIVGFIIFVGLSTWLGELMGFDEGLALLSGAALLIVGLVILGGIIIYVVENFEIRKKE